jgi:ribonuclease PH
VQGTAEGPPFERAMMDRLIDLAAGGIRDLNTMQREAIAQLGIDF